MPDYSLFPFTDYWWFYGLFTLGVLAFLALDLGVFHREAHEVGFKEALTWSVVWIGLAMAFCFGLWKYTAWKLPQDPRLLAEGITAAQAAALADQTALEFLTGFVVEKSLSVDNIFVFVVVFSYFAIPSKYQHRVLFYGILGALIFRIIFISIGAALMQLHWVIWVFGGFLILTGLKILFAPEKPIEPDRNPIIRLLRRLIPVTPQLHGDRFFLRKDGVLYATPLLVTLVFIELSDIVFAVDSVPAIFAITQEPFVVYTSNIFAILGLRALYFALAAMIHRFRYLKYALALVLVFIGCKIFAVNLFGKMPPWISLGTTFGLVAGGIAYSLWRTRQDERALRTP